jgi:hypothetical protein
MSDWKPPQPSKNDAAPGPHGTRTTLAPGDVRNPKENGPSVGSVLRRATEPTPRASPFPPEHLPPIIGDLVDVAAVSIGCDPVLVAPPALTVTAAWIGNSCAVLLKKGWTEPAAIWSATVAESGGHKSPVFATAGSNRSRGTRARAAAATAPGDCNCTGPAHCSSTGKPGSPGGPPCAARSYPSLIPSCPAPCRGHSARTRCRPAWGHGS